MNRYLYRIWVIYLLAASSSLSAQDYINQRYDRQRIIMPALGGACPNLDSSNHVYINGVRFDFRSDSLQMIAVDTFVSQAIIPYYTINEAAQICNKQGQIAAYFNGGELWDRNEHKIIIDMFKYASSTMNFALAYNYNSCLILPMPLSESQYVLIGTDDYHYDRIYGVEAGKQLSAVYLDELSDGTLTISRIDSNLHQSSYTKNGSVTACRHANGRDWWVVSPKRWGTYFNVFLLEPGGLRFSHESTVADTIFDAGYAPEFSPDGRWYTRTRVEHLTQYKKKNFVQFFPFDRCSGTFGAPFVLRMPQEDTTSIGQAWFDATSRYVYFATCSSLFQADMWAADIQASLVKVSGYDHSLHDSGGFLCMGYGFLAPDGKAYIVDGRNNFRTTVVHNPSARGLACDARYAELVKPSCSGSALGNMPDFNLGPEDGTLCDSLGLDAVSIHSSSTASAPLTISPSPTTGDCTVMLPSQGGSLTVYDAQGAIRADFLIQNYQMEQALSLPLGVYYVAYRSTDGLINTGGKVVVIR